MNADAGAGLHIREAGDAAVLLQAAPVIDPHVNARVVGVADAIRRRGLAGVRDVVSTIHSVAVFFDPLSTDVETLTNALREEAASAAPQSAGKTIDVPVSYGGAFGPDLGDVAAFAGCAPEAVIERHSAPTYRVFMLGFLPGYPYMGLVDETIAAPRKATPRLRVLAGSVGIAGRQTGIYPRDSPGGWQIIGRTSLDLFDPDRSPPALLAPGDNVRFIPVRDPHVMNAGPGFSRTVVRLKADPTHPTSEARSVTVLRPGLLTTVQDEGRWGYQSHGVAVSGAMDPVAHRLANALVGNARAAATLEVTLLGPELRLEQDTRIAVAGADLAPTVDGAAVPIESARECRAGSVIRFGERRSGARAYVAFDGGVAVPQVLGSRATHVLSAMGGTDGRALRAGDRIPLGPPPPGFGEARRSASRHVDTDDRGARLRVLPGPQAERFDSSALDALQHSRYIVSPQSDRMGYRLTGGTRITAAGTGDMISDAVFAGGVQVPPAGDPILLMADRQTTGGYPQIAVVITADLPLAAQLAPGDWVAFEVCSRSQALAALRDQEGQLAAR